MVIVHVIRFVKSVRYEGACARSHLVLTSHSVLRTRSFSRLESDRFDCVASLQASRRIRTRARAQHHLRLSLGWLQENQEFSQQQYHHHGPNTAFGVEG